MQLQYIYKYNIPFRREYERLNLLHRQARNPSLLINSVLSCSKHLFGRFNQWDCYTPAQKTYIFSYDLSKKVIAAGWRNIITNTTMIVRTILRFIIDGLKIATEKFIAPFPDAIVKKRIFFSSSWFSKNDKNVCILPFVQLHLSIANELEVVRFIARWAVVLCVQSDDELNFRPCGVINW